MATISSTPSSAPRTRLARSGTLAKRHRPWYRPTSCRTMPWVITATTSSVASEGAGGAPAMAASQRRPSQTATIIARSCRTISSRGTRLVRLCMADLIRRDFRGGNARSLPAVARRAQGANTQ